MPNNILLTGKPGVGKTTAVRETVRRLRDRGEVTVSGIYSPEMREDGERVGFRIEPVGEGEDGEVMAHTEYRAPKVGKYGVDVSAVDTVARRAIRAEDADLVVVDEIAPMQTHSDVFVERVRGVLDDKRPVAGVVQKRRKTGFVGEVKDRTDTELIHVTRKNRDEVPGEVLCRLDRID